MHDQIQISKINDFLFCPYSLYVHGIYESFTEKTYHQKPQYAGKIAHKSIDSSSYSSEKRYIQGISVFSSKYNIVGKIDIFDTKTKMLIERKKRIKTIFTGQIYQLYAQMLCLTEMGYSVESLCIHSLDDNIRYPLPLPNDEELKKFTLVLEEMTSFDIEKSNKKINEAKCLSCIYSQLCTYTNL